MDCASLFLINTNEFVTGVDFFSACTSSDGVSLTGDFLDGVFFVWAP